MRFDQIIDTYGLPIEYRHKTWPEDWSVSITDTKVLTGMVKIIDQLHVAGTENTWEVSLEPPQWLRFKYETARSN